MTYPILISFVHKCFFVENSQVDFASVLEYSRLRLMEVALEAVGLDLNVERNWRICALASVLDHLRGLGLQVNGLTIGLTAGHGPCIP